MKKTLFLSFSVLVVPAFIAVAQQYSGLKDIKPPTAAPAINIQPAMPMTQPIRIEVGRDIAKSVEIKQVPGNEIKVLPPAATVIYTPPPEVAHASHTGH